MATKTGSPDLAAVNIAASTNQFLEFRLKISGARANFAWVDDDGTSILTHMDFPNFHSLDELVWQLKTKVDASGKVVLTVPQNGAYSRSESVGALTVYTLTLLFVSAIGYGLKVNLCGTGGNVITPITDVQIKMAAETDVFDQTLAVVL